LQQAPANRIDQAMRRFIFSFLPGGLFAVTAPVVFYVVNPDNRIFNSWRDILGSIFLTLALFGAFYLLAYLFTHGFEAAGLIAAVLVIGAFYLWQIALALAAIVLIALLALKIARRKIKYATINYLLGMLALVLAGFYGAQLVLFLVQVPSTASRALVDPVIESEVDADASGEKPDIYYIILDGYGRADMLEDIYGYDNSAFIQALQGLGFVVPGSSRANYPRTVLSLGSSLNMQYLDTTASVMDDSPVWWPMEEALYHSQVRDFLEDKGYRTIFLASGFDFTDVRDGDEYVKPFPIMLNNFEGGYVRFTSLSILGDLNHLVSYPSYATQRQTIQASFAALPQVALEAGPKFVFAHITAPHPPFVFDEAGDPVDPDYPYTLADKMRLIMDVPTYKQSYTAEVRYLNSQVLKTVSAILANSPTPPVIILQGDHGPGLYLDNQSAANTCLYERFSILNAYYLPGKQSVPIPASITPVNTFRLVFNEYFSTRFAQLADKSYFESLARFYTFEDITDQIESACAQQNQP
jgi:Sulfatase